MSIVLHGHPRSPFVRSVHMTLEILGIDYEFKFVDLGAGEHKKPEYLKLNPQHNVPVLVDGDLVLNESRAICIYLVQMYGGKGHKLFPEAVETQARINQRLYFDATVFWPACRECFAPLVFKGVKEVSQPAVEKLNEVFGWLEGFIKPTGFIAGTDSVTLADLAAYAVYSTIIKTGSVYVDVTKFPEVGKWAERCKAAVPNHKKANEEGSEMFEKLFKEKAGL